MDSGIYIWKNKVTGRVLVGQTTNFVNRKRTYLSRLKNGKHNNCHFQRSWDKHGAENFEFNIVQHVEHDPQLILKYVLTAYEKVFLDYYRKLPAGVYNQKDPEDSNAVGVKRSEETSRKISALKSGEKHHQYGKPRTEEVKIKIREAMLKRVNPPEVGHKISKAKMGHSVSLETRRKLSAKIKGCKHTPEAIEKIRMASLAMWQKKRESEKAEDPHYYQGVAEESGIH